MPILTLFSGEAPPAANEHVFTIGNRSTAGEDLVIGTASIVGSTAFTITADHVSSMTFGPGHTGTITVAFNPVVDGQLEEAVLHIPSSDPDGAYDIDLSGRGYVPTAPIIAVDPASWNAGSAATSSGRPTKTFTVTNTGTADLVMGTVAVTGSDFPKSSDGVSGATIPPGQSRTVVVTFTPTTTGAKSATLTFPNNAGPDVTRALTGTSVRSITVTPTQWQAGSVTVGNTVSTTATVRSTGTLGITVGTVSVAGTNFAKGTDNATGQALAPAASRTVVVQFTPSSAVARTGTLTVPWDGTSIVVPLAGTGTAATVTPLTKEISVTPASWDAGDVTINTVSILGVSVKSTGTGPITIGTCVVTGAKFSKLTDGASGQVIPAGTTKLISVQFAPTSNGAQTGSLTIPNDAGASIVVSLAGNGTNSVVEPDPPPPPPPGDGIPTYQFWLGRQTAPAGVTVPNSLWNVHTVDATNALTTAKGGPSPAWGTTTNASTVTNGVTRLGRWIGPPMAAQVVTTPFTAYCTAAYRSADLGPLITSALRMGVWRAATGAMAWLPLMAHTGPVDPWPTSDGPLPRRMPGGPGASWSVTLAFDAGDRLVIEAGCRRCAGGPTAGVRMRWGGASTDADLSDTQTAQPLVRASWIAFALPLLVQS